MSIDVNTLRALIVEVAYSRTYGGVGSALSVADIVAALYGSLLNVSDPGDPDRDRVVISKGHAALAFYCALNLRGWLTTAELNAFYGDPTLLGTHPVNEVPGIDFCSGSLGQGLSFGVGAALAARLDGSPRLTYVVMSDAELNEGSVWEAAMFAAHHKLDNLVAIVDANGQQAFGYTADVMSLEPIRSRWEAFGWDVVESPGHDAEALVRSCAAMLSNSGLPHVLIARTTFGFGVPFMEADIEWHYRHLTEDEAREARASLSGMRGPQE